MICPDPRRLFEHAAGPALVRPERRRHPRYPLRISLVVRMLDVETREVQWETVQAWTEDVSTSGTRIICPRLPITGPLWINLRTRRLRKQWFEAGAVWSAGVTTTKGLRQRVGVSFVQPLDRGELDRMLVARALSQLRKGMG